MAIPEGGVCFLDDGLPDMVPDTGRVQGEFIRVIARSLRPDRLDTGAGKGWLGRCYLVSGSQTDRDHEDHGVLLSRYLFA